MCALCVFQSFPPIAQVPQLQPPSAQPTQQDNSNLSSGGASIDREDAAEVISLSPKPHWPTLNWFILCWSVRLAQGVLWGVKISDSSLCWDPELCLFLKVGLLDTLRILNTFWYIMYQGVSYLSWRRPEDLAVLSIWTLWGGRLVCGSMIMCNCTLTNMFHRVRGVHAWPFIYYPPTWAAAHFLEDFLSLFLEGA